LNREVYWLILKMRNKDAFQKQKRFAPKKNEQYNFKKRIE